MSTRDLMQDPHYAGLMFEIESKIYEHDQETGGDVGVNFTDSDTKSSIRKTMSILRGKRPLTTPKNEKERLKGKLSIELVGVYEYEHKTANVSRGAYIKALLAVEDSLKTRHDHHGHSRGYLDFLVGFMNDAQTRKAESGRRGDLPPPATGHTGP